MNMLRRIRRFLRRDDGPTAVEYAVMLLLVVTLCLAAIRSIGSNTHPHFTKVANSLGGS